MTVSAASEPSPSARHQPGLELQLCYLTDNYTNAPAEVRTKMVEAYRLVSESRPDA